MSGGQVLVGGERWVGEHRLDEDHLGGLDHGLDHLHGGPEPPGLQGLWGVGRLQGPEKHTQINVTQDVSSQHPPDHTG